MFVMLGKGFSSFWCFPQTPSCFAEAQCHVVAVLTPPIRCITMGQIQIFCCTTSLQATHLRLMSSHSCWHGLLNTKAFAYQVLQYKSLLGCASKVWTSCLYQQSSDSCMNKLRSCILALSTIYKQSPICVDKPPQT